MTVLKFCLCLIISLFQVTTVQSKYSRLSDNEIRIQARLLNVYSEAVLDRTKIGLISLSNILQRSNLSQKEGHELFGQLVKELDGIRAIIFIQSDGKLLYDSFSYPTPDVNLKERKYFIETMASSTDRLLIGKQIKGKTSSIPFLPVTMRVNKDNQFFGVLTAIVTPSVLVSSGSPQHCLHCISLLTDLEGNIIADHPSGLEITEELKKKLHATSQPVKGTEVIDIGKIKARIYWIRNEEFPYISIFLEFIGS